MKENFQTTIEFLSTVLNNKDLSNMCQTKNVLELIEIAKEISNMSEILNKYL